MIILALVFLLPAVTWAQEIIIDGDFSEWQGKPEEQFYYSAYKEGRTHTVKWYKGEDGVFVYIKMGVRANMALEDGMVILYYVNNSSFPTILVLHMNESGDGSVSVEDSDGNMVTDGYIVRGDNGDGITSDQAEFRIPYTFFGQAEGTSFSAKMKFPDLGKQTIIMEGISTYSFIGILLCILAVGMRFVFKQKRREAK